MGKPITVLGFLGTQLDASAHGKPELERFRRWRPTVGLVSHEALPVSRLVLLHPPRFDALAELVSRDVAKASPETEVERLELKVRDPWDFEEVFAALLDFSRSRSFENEELLVHITTGTHVQQICLFLLVEARWLPGRLVQTSPPPVADRKSARAAREESGAGRFQIVDLDLARYDAIARRFAKERAASVDALKQGIATKNAAYNRTIEALEKVVLKTRAPILLEGPTGAGKTQLARRLYDLKKARGLISGPFVDVNCATLRGDGASSTLFGHEKGAFTGAIASRSGLLKSADKGMLFLDEIGELGLDEQAMLLRAVEDRAFRPVGSDREVKSDFSLLAGTNRDLRRDVAEGRFREDLLARIDVWTFRLPGLKERLEDFEPNLAFQLERVSLRTGTRITMTREAQARFVRFARAPEALWSASFRDLDAAVTRMATLAPDGRIGEADVKAEIERLHHAWRRGSAKPGETDDVLASVLSPEALDDLDLFDRAQLAEVIRTCRASRSISDAGRTLFAASRKKRSSVNDADRLRKYLARFSLTFEDLHATPPNA